MSEKKDYFATVCKHIWNEAHWSKKSVRNQIIRDHDILNFVSPPKTLAPTIPIMQHNVTQH